MARRKHSNPFEEELEPEMNISPLIDVAFLLLIYFLVTTTLEPQEADIGLILPGVATTESEPVKVDQALVKITGDSAISWNGTILDTDPNDRNLQNLSVELLRYATAAKNAGSEAMVVVDCDDDVPEQRFIDVLNSCAAAGLKNITLTQ